MRWTVRTLRDRVRSGEGQAAFIFTVDHADETFLTPAGTPTVLDIPVGGARGSAITNEQDTVVEVGTTRWVAEDTTRVELEAGLVGFNSNRNRADSEGLVESFFIAFSDVLEARDGRDGSNFLASSINSLVWLRSFRSNTLVGDDVLESIVHQTTIATLVALATSTVDQLLFREGGQGLLLKLDGTFNRTGG